MYSPFYCNHCDAERDTCEPTFCASCEDVTEGYALPTSEYLTADDLTPAAKARVVEVERQTLERYVTQIERAFNAPRRVDQLKARRLAGAAATAAAIALATPAAAEPLLPVATDDAVIATSDATDHSFRMPPDYTGEPATTRPDLSRDRWLMCGAFAFDAATTIWSVESGNHEAAPITRAVIGKRPSPLAVAGFMAAKCGAFLALGTVLERTGTRGAKLFYRINIGVATVAGVNNVGVALKVRF